MPGTSTTYTIVVSNAGPSRRHRAALSDPLPAGVTAATWTFVAPDGRRQRHRAAQRQRALSTTVNLPVGATVTFSFTATIDPTATGTLTNIATVTPTAGTPTSGSDSDALTPQADLSVTKTDGKVSRRAGHARHLHHHGQQRRPEHGEQRQPDRRRAGGPAQPGLRHAQPRAATTRPRGSGAG